MKTIAFDESGNSGENVLDINQPVFVLASVYVEDEEASQLLNLFDTPSDELKFKKILKSGKHITALQNFLSSNLLNENSVGLFVYNKEYSISVHTVDRLIDASYYEAGIDIYKDGMNIALANLLFYYLPSMCDKELYERHKQLFTLMFRNRTAESINDFYDNFEKLAKSAKDNGEAIFLPIIESAKHIDFILSTTPKYGLDSTLAGLISLVDMWGKKLNSKFNILVDDSKPLRHFEHYIDILKSLNIEKQSIGYDRRNLKLPLQIDNMHFVNSVFCQQVRVADILAGAANYYCKAIINNTIETDTIAKMIANTPIESWIKESVWPSKAVTPEQLNIHSNGEENLLDGMIRATKDSGLTL